MSVEFRGSTSRPAEDPLTADASPVAGQHAYVAFAAALFDYCARLLGDQVEAACAVQDSLVAVNAQFSNMPKPEQLRVPLYAAARRQCLSRRPGRRPRLTGRSGKTAAGHAGVASPDDGVPTSDGTAPRTVGETLPAVTAAVARLPDRDREVLNLAFRHGINGADLAAVLGLSSRRTRSLLSGASDRFGKSAAVEVVLRSGGAGAVGRDAGCPVLAGIVSQQDAVPAPLAAKLIRLNRHVESCSDCACTLGDRTFSPGLISQVPLTVPADRLRLRMIRTALALGSYRRQVTSLRNDVDSGRPRSRSGGGRAPQGRWRSRRRRSPSWPCRASCSTSTSRDRRRGRYQPGWSRGSRAPRRSRRSSRRPRLARTLRARPCSRPSPGRGRPRSACCRSRHAAGHRRLRFRCRSPRRQRRGHRRPSRRRRNPRRRPRLRLPRRLLHQPPRQIPRRLLHQPPRQIPHRLPHRPPRRRRRRRPPGSGRERPRRRVRPLLVGRAV
jgi:DNA-directed RNA polymerase specialized sigma24 family protein